MFATSLGHPGTERALLEAGADVNAQEQVCCVGRVGFVIPAELFRTVWHALWLV